MSFKRTSPRTLEHTELFYKPDEEGNLVYGNPFEIADSLYSSQGSADKEYQETCGLCAVVNVLRLAGVDISEKQVLDYYKRTLGLPLGFIWLVPILKHLRMFKGGTNARMRKNILRHFGIRSMMLKCVAYYAGKYENDIDLLESDMYDQACVIAEYIEQGRGVIVPCLGWLYDYSRYKGNHALVVTGVKRDPEGQLLGFFVHDSNGDAQVNVDECSDEKIGKKYYKESEFMANMTAGKINVTSTIIR